MTKFTPVNNNWWGSGRICRGPTLFRGTNKTLVTLLITCSLLITLRRCRWSRRNVSIRGERRRWHDDPSKKKRRKEGGGQSRV
jgi:hypothetical protein